MTYSILPSDLLRVVGVIERNESMLFGDDGFGEDDIVHFDSHPRYSVGLMLSDAGELAAYSFMKMLKPGKIRILRLCVLPEFQKQGIGKSIHDAILLAGHQYRIRVPETWLETQLWLKKHGWTAVGIAPDGYEFRKYIDSDYAVS